MGPHGTAAWVGHREEQVRVVPFPLGSPKERTGFLGPQSSDAPFDFWAWPVAKCCSIPTPARSSLSGGDPGLGALPLHFPTQPLVVLVNVAKMVVSLGLVWSGITGLETFGMGQNGMFCPVRMGYKPCHHLGKKVIVLLKPKKKKKCVA